MLGEMDVLPWRWEVSPNPTAPAAESAPSSSVVLIVTVQQQNKYSEISIKAIIRGASLAF